MPCASQNFVLAKSQAIRQPHESSSRKARTLEAAIAGGSAWAIPAGAALAEGSVEENVIQLGLILAFGLLVILTGGVRAHMKYQPRYELCFVGDWEYPCSLQKFG